VARNNISIALPLRVSADARRRDQLAKNELCSSVSFTDIKHEAFVGQATKIAELYADLGKECYKPFVGIIGKKTSMS
jgi:hypothetical protein